MTDFDYKALDRLKADTSRIASTLPPDVLDNYNRDFDITYAHDSTQIEGNTLSLVETKVLLDDGISIGGKKLREVYEVTNHDRAFTYVRQLIREGRPLDEELVKDIHEILMQNIMQGGIYRSHAVRIIGASHRPPEPYDMLQQIKFFFADMPTNRETMHPVELAAWTHAEFVRIHPFADGNGRTSRMIMNYQLMSGGFLPISIKAENQAPYYTALDQYATERNLMPFLTQVYDHEKAALLDFIASYGEGAAHVTH